MCNHTDIFKVADYLIYKSHTLNNNPITLFKLHKLLYYAQAKHLSLTNHKMFDNDFFAYPHGPVIVEINNKYKQYGLNPIPNHVTDYSDISNVHVNILDDIWNTYGHLNAKQLEMIISKEKPWREARGQFLHNNTYVISDKIIDPQHMKNLFKRD